MDEETRREYLKGALSNLIIEHSIPEVLYALGEVLTECESLGNGVYVGDALKCLSKIE